MSFADGALWKPEPWNPTWTLGLPVLSLNADALVRTTLRVLAMEKELDAKLAPLENLATVHASAE